MDELSFTQPMLLVLLWGVLAIAVMWIVMIRVAQALSCMVMAVREIGSSGPVMARAGIP